MNKIDATSIVAMKYTLQGYMKILEFLRDREDIRGGERVVVESAIKEMEGAIYYLNLISESAE